MKDENRIVFFIFSVSVIILELRWGLDATKDTDKPSILTV